MAFRDDNRRSALDRLKTVRGHLTGIIRMIESDVYCVDVMKQISATQASLERVNRIVLKNHLETCFSDAVKAGTSAAAIEELVDAVKFNSALTGADARFPLGQLEEQMATTQETS